MPYRMKLFGTAYPIVQAPMANAASIDLAIAVSKAGGLGSFAAGMLGPEQIRAAIRAIRVATPRPFNINLFAHRIAPPDQEKLARIGDVVARLEAETGADGLDFEPPPPPPSFEEQLKIVIEERVPVFSFTFGLPSSEQIAALRQSGALIVGTATSVEEAQALEAGGVDAVVAQGIEAGGHRGSFLETASPSPPTMELVAECAGAVRIPVVASGGIMTGDDAVRAFGQGAAAVQLGTAFLCCPEARLIPAWREAILAGSETAITRALTGKRARAIRNRLVEAMEEHEADLPDYPYVAIATARLRAWAAARHDADFLALLSGAGTKRVRPMPAADLIATLVSEMAAARAEAERRPV